jgi:hypothetical protein
MQIIYQDNKCKIISPMGELETDNLLIKVIAKYLIDTSQVISDLIIPPSKESTQKRIMTLLWDREDQFIDYILQNVIPSEKKNEQ